MDKNTYSIPGAHAFLKSSLPSGKITEILNHPTVNTIHSMMKMIIKLLAIAACPLLFSLLESGEIGGTEKEITFEIKLTFI